MAILSNTNNYIEVDAEQSVGQSYEVTYTGGYTSSETYSYGTYINEPDHNYFTFDPITFIGQDNAPFEQSKPEKKNIRKVSRFELMDLD